MKSSKCLYPKVSETFSKTCTNQKKVNDLKKQQNNKLFKSLLIVTYSMILSINLTFLYLDLLIYEMGLIKVSTSRLNEKNVINTTSTVPGTQQTLNKR